MTTMAARSGEFLLSEAPGTLSREAVVVASGAGSLAAGSVLGRITRRQAAAPIPTIVGTGSGVMTGLTFGPDVQVGAYVITLTETSATAAFTVVAPDGTSLPNGAVGTAYRSNHLSFAIANGGTMTLADAFTVTVTAGGTPVLVGTGTGVVSAFSLGPRAQPGTYKVRVTATSATAVLEVQRTDQSLAKDGKIAVAYAGDEINFTLSNAGTMTIDDYFNVIVAGHTTPEADLWDPTDTTGLSDAYGILLAASDATSAAQDAVAIVRMAEVVADSLAWKTTVTAAQKTAAYRQLAAANVIVRS